MRVLRLSLWVLMPAAVGTAAFALKSGAVQRNWAVITKSDPMLDCPSVLDLGEQEIGATVARKFVLRNHGGKDLFVDRIQSSCSCSVLEREVDGTASNLESLRVAPGEQAELYVRVGIGGRPGDAFRSSIIFRTNDPAHQQAIIGVVAPRLRGGVVAVPMSVAFGSLPLNSQTRFVLDVYDGGVGRRRISKVISSHPERFAVEFREAAESEAPGDTVRHGGLVAKVIITPNTRHLGQLDGEVTIHLAGENRPPDIIPVLGRIVDIVEITPSALLLPRHSSQGFLYVARCVCRATTGEPLTVAPEEVPDGLVVTTLSDKNAASAQVIEVEWKAPRDLAGGSQRKMVRLRATAGGRTRVVSLPVLYSP